MHQVVQHSNQLKISNDRIKSLLQHIGLDVDGYGLFGVFNLTSSKFEQRSLPRNHREVIQEVKIPKASDEAQVLTPSTLVRHGIQGKPIQSLITLAV